jgi:hypothetical protein
MSYILFLDDIRQPSKVYPETFDAQWVIARNYKEFVNAIETRGLPELVSFDHDLAEEHYPFNEPQGGIRDRNNIPYQSYKEKTGYDAAKFLVQYCLDMDANFPECRIHSMNPVGRKNIKDHLFMAQTYQVAVRREKRQEIDPTKT